MGFPRRKPGGLRVRSVDRRGSFRETDRVTFSGKFCQLFQVCQQFLLAGPVHQVVADHLVGAQCRLTARPQTDQHAGDDRAIGLDTDTLGVIAQQVTTAENVFEEAKEQFSLPLILPPKMTLLSG